MITLPRSVRRARAALTSRNLHGRKLRKVTRRARLDLW